MTEAVNRARQQHPLIVAARQRAAMATGERLDAGRRPNPSLFFSGENFPAGPLNPNFGFTRSIDWFATVSQTFETGQKRELRAAVAEGDVNYAETEIAAVERQVIYEVKAAYEQALLARARVGLARETLTHFQQLVNLNEIRVKAGYSSEGDLIKARLEAQRIDIAARRAVLEYDRAKIHLLRAMGATSFDPDFHLSGELQFEPVSVNFKTLSEAAMRQPQVRAAEFKLERAQAALRLEQARAKPDYTVSFGYKRNGPDNALYGAVSVPLPVFNKNGGQIAKAEAAVRAAEAELSFVRSQTLAELAAAQRAIENYREQVEALQHDFLQRADESQHISLAAYREGAVELIVLLEAQRARGQAQELFFQAVHDYRLAVFEMERAAGIERLPTLRQVTEAQPEKTDAAKVGQ
jgi:cobalt-zinc-cadmium efflux system outer membrane protein